ncbi:MAG: hypothetical protein RLZZ437_3252 [Pseudomonadota bacterium]|jgi:hypothetical protein
MTWYSLTDDSGQAWAFNLDGMYLIIRSAVRTRLIRSRARMTEHNAGWFLPTTYNLEVNWSGYRAELDRETNRYWENCEMQLRTDPRPLMGSLVGLINDAVTDHNWFIDRTREASSRSTASIDRCVTNWDRAITGARFVRDGSATFLIVTAGIVSGGAGLAAATGAGMTGVTTGTAMTTLAVGSGMRGAFTYQDTGNVGSAVLNASGSFIVGAIGIGGASATLTSAETATLLVIGGAGSALTSGGQAIVEGKSMREAGMVAAISGISSVLGGVAGGRIDTMAFAVQAGVGTGLDLGGGVLANWATSPSERTPVPTRHGRLDFIGLPMSIAEQFVRSTALTRI